MMTGSHQNRWQLSSMRQGVVPILLFAFLASSVWVPLRAATRADEQSKRFTDTHSSDFITETIESVEEEETEGGDALLSAVTCSPRAIDLSVERAVFGATCALISKARFRAAPKRDPTA